ncbi:hypothetical protein HDU99_006696 [Rhizoclosmatium hyalinum]|nr:hypothetical protein HDU99_006696 [Rhizoclosmatium hyalinum]
MHDLAICYKNGVGVKENQKTAFGLLKKAAEGGYHQSQFYVGVRYMEGNGVKRNEEAGIEWIKKSHEGGNEQAAEYLSLILGDDEDEDESREASDADSESEVDLDFGSMAIGESDGLIDGIMRMQEIVEKLDFDAIVQYQGDNPGLSIEDVLQSHITQQLQILVDEGEPFALHQMSVFYSNGIRGIARDTKKAFELIMEASEKGYLPATHDLALCYLNGDGVQKNTKRSVELLTKAAEGGFVMSQLSLANRLLAGEGVKKDEKLGFSWVKKAAAHGHVNAIFTLGKCHWNGAGTTQCFQLAVRYFKDAASKDDGESNFYLGLAHESGLGGLRKDAEKAYQSFLACVEAEPNRATNIAMYNLGVLCFNKVTSTGRKSDAAGWFEKSETPTGHYALGFMHRLGIGARKNDRMSQQYFSRALMSGYIPAMIALTNSRAKMPVLETIICLCNETDCEH